MIDLIVNGRSVEVDDDPATPLLYVLRGTLELNGAKYGCGLGQCGACTVIAGSQAIFSCITPISALAEQAAQCGYCIPGMMMRAQALLDRNPAPSDAEIRAALAPHLCRCGSHMRVLRAIRRASRASRTVRRRCARASGAVARGRPLPRKPMRAGPLGPGRGRRTPERTRRRRRAGNARSACRPRG
jgi:nicotinate dehydrogenase subunit A